MSNKPEQNCSTCKNGYALKINGHIICRKNGVILPADHCNSYEFDPFRREPTPRNRTQLSYTETDFSID